MEINEITMERIAEKVLSAMKREGLMNKEVAEIFDCSPADLSHLKRSDCYNKISNRIKESMRAWYYSDKPLRGYTLPEAMPEPPDVIPEDVVFADNTDIATTLPVERKETAAKVRKEYKRTKQIILPRDINPKNGLKLSVQEVTEGYILTITLPR